MPGGLSIRSSATAWTVARCRLRLPSSLRIAGRTNTSNDTSALTGLPGRQKIGTRSPRWPKPCGLPGCMATWVNSTVPELGQRLLDHVEGAHADAAGGDQEVGAQQLALEHVEQLGVVVGHDADAAGVGAGVLAAAAIR